ncbi:MAG: CDP-alcohol phosphatidyltransferase family protein [Rhodospirillaceae bacterium]|nr:CDP-alcohol phosphatidyltransferase family protein [Rhodospirillaceae bacterium]
MNLPNLITLLRLASAPVIVWFLLTGRFGPALWLFAVAGASDAIDGYLARTRGERTRLGAVLDPIADKTLMICAFVALGYAGAVADWLVFLVVLRDVVIVAGLGLLHRLGRPVAMAPSMLSKANTVVQTGFVALVLSRLGLGLAAPGWAAAIGWGHYAVAATTIASGLHYVAVGLRHWGAADAGAARP